MTDPIVYLTMPVSAPPVKNDTYFVLAVDPTGHPFNQYRTSRKWLDGKWERRPKETILSWLLPKPLSELIAEKIKEGQADLIWEMIQENQDADEGPFTKEDIESDLYDWFKKIDLVKIGATQKLEAELSALKSRVLQIAEESWEKAVLHCRDIYHEEWFSDNDKPADKSTYIANLKKELNEKG